MMQFFSELLDYPYPYPKYAPGRGRRLRRRRMENTTVSLFNDSLIGSAGEIEDLDGNPRIIVAHELAHQWFGDLVTCFGWSHLWLNEAWASYLELLFVREKEGSNAFRLWLERYREWYQARGEQANTPVAVDWHTQEHAEERREPLLLQGTVDPVHDPRPRRERRVLERRA